jgi:DNA-binding CsgD family transcriptional regulator
MFEPHMLLKIEELARFLTSGAHNASALGKQLVDKTLETFDLISLYFFRADHDGKLRFAGGHNLPAALMENIPTFEIENELPVTECIRNQKIIWLTGQEEWETQYPEMKNYPLQPELRTFINVPLQVEGHPIAALGLSSRAEVKRSAELTSFLSAVSGITGLYAQNLPEFKSARPGGISRRVLSRRQNNILNLMREKLTNREIGDELGYSESTIRQETMRIYQILNVDNRRQAAAFKFIED